MRKTFSWLIAIVIVVSMGLVLSGCTPPEGENVSRAIPLSGPGAAHRGVCGRRRVGVRVWKSPKI